MIEYDFPEDMQVILSNIQTDSNFTFLSNFIVNCGMLQMVKSRQLKAIIAK